MISFWLLVVLMSLLCVLFFYLVVLVLGFLLEVSCEIRDRSRG